MADESGDSDKFSDEEDIQTLMQKNSRKRDYDDEEEDDDASSASASSNENGVPQKSFLETMRHLKQQKALERLMHDEDSDDDIVVQAVHPPPAATKPTTKPILELDDSSDEDLTATQRAKQSMVLDPSLLKLQYARRLAQYNCGDHTQILEQQAEMFASQHAEATRRNFFDIRPVWHAPSETLPTLPSVVRIVRTPDFTQVQHLKAQLLRQLEFKRAEHYTVALRLDKHLLGDHEHVSKLTKGVLQAVLYHDGVMVKTTASVPKKKMIRLTIRSPDGKNEHEFRVGEGDPFSELMELYFQKSQVRVTLHFDGDALRPNQTPKMMDMEDEDLIDSKAI